MEDALSRLYSYKSLPDDLRFELKTKYERYHVPPTYFNLDLTI